jgi:restriction system protein
MNEKRKPTVPRYFEFMNPILAALYKMGGSGTTHEIYEATAEDMKLSEDILTIPHGKSYRTKVEYNIAWALTYLKKAGLLNNSSRGIWNLSNPSKLITLSEKEIKKIRFIYLKKEQEDKDKAEEAESAPEIDNWKTNVLGFIKNVSPDAFERLCQRLLRESGFIEVTVTGRSGDGGIDGHGILRLAGLVSFRVFFQSKRYNGSVTASQIRDFRGAMIGRADRGLFITTGTFTKDSQKEATRDGAPIIDLVDGELLIEKLKELHLGIETRQIEEVTVLKEWFNKL